MVKFLLDTDHVSLLQRRAGREFHALTARMSAHPQNEFALCIVSFHEQTLGANNFLAKARSRDEFIRGYEIFEVIREMFIRSPVLPMDRAAATVFDTLRSAGTHVRTMDLRIAAIALTNNLSLLTRNTVDFARVPGLQFEDWTL